MDAVPGEPESLLRERLDGLVVIRSLTKHWSIPGIRAGYVAGDPAFIAALARVQTPWSVAGPAVAAIVACSDARAVAEAAERAREIGRLARPPRHRPDRARDRARPVVRVVRARPPRSRSPVAA